MSKKPPKNNERLDKFVEKVQKKQRRSTRRDNTQQQIQLMPSVRPKRIINLTQFLKKSESTGLKQQHESITMQKYLQEKSINQILENCQQLHKWVNDMARFLDMHGNHSEQQFMSFRKVKNNTKRPMHQKCSKSKGKILKVMQKFFKSLPNTLWSIKYQPKLINELFDNKTVQQIILWIKAYKKCRHIPFFVNQKNSEDSFIDDQQYSDFADHDSESIMAHVNQNRWKCRALILKGRPNIGKTSIVRVISDSLNYSIHQCSADLNQQKYLRQNNQSTKSQNVQIAPKKQKFEKNNTSINKYFPILSNLKQSQSQKAQMNALQFIRDLNCVYPEKSREKFYKYLCQSIAMSKVPFVLTTSSLIPNQYEKYDIMQLNRPETYQQQIGEELWIIYIVQKTLGNIFGRQFRNTLVKEGYFMSEFNFAVSDKLESLAPNNKEVMNNQDGLTVKSSQNHFKLFFKSIQKTISLVRMFQYNLNLIFNFLQFKPLQKAYEEAALKFQRIDLTSLIENQYEKQYLKSITASAFGPIKDKVMGQEQKENNQMEGTNDTGYLQDRIYDGNSKGRTFPDTNQQNLKIDRQCLKNKIQLLKLERLADIKYEQNNAQIKDQQQIKANINHFKYQKLFYQHSRQKIAQNLHQNIPQELHKKAKTSICSDFTRQTKDKRMFANQYHVSTLKPNELSYLPMIAIVRRTRKAEITFEQTLCKFTDKKRVHYLKQFTNIDFELKQAKKVRHGIEKYLIVD